MDSAPAPAACKKGGGSGLRDQIRKKRGALDRFARQLLHEGSPPGELDSPASDVVLAPFSESAAASSLGGPAGGVASAPQGGRRQAAVRLLPQQPQTRTTRPTRRRCASESTPTDVLNGIVDSPAYDAPEPN
eukprot:8107700-Alexandrium_andersonii.AAC.1